MSLGFDTCMNNYTTSDLLSLLDLGSNPSYIEITNKVNIFTDMFSTLTDISENVQNEIVGFFENIQDKLLDDISNNTADNANEYNYFDYNIENSDMSQLPLAAPNFHDDNDLNPENLIQCYSITENEIHTIQTHQEDIKIEEPKTYEMISKSHHFSNTDNIININKDSTLFKFSFKNTLSDVIELYLSSITMPVPYNISNYLNNNKFYIIDGSGVEYLIELSDQYFYHNYDLSNLILELNTNYFNNIDNSNNILYYISISYTLINSSQTIIKFDISNGNPISSTFSLNFDVPNKSCSPNYKLNTLLNLDISYTSVTNVTSKKFSYPTFNTYVCLNDYTFNYNQNLEVINSNIFQNDIIAHIQKTANDLVDHNYMIKNTFIISTISQTNRKYTGPVDLLQFEINFIDFNGNFLQLPEDYTSNDTFNFMLTTTTMRPTINKTYTYTN